MSDTDSGDPKRSPAGEKPFKRRVRYSGKNPRHYSQKYKELDPQRDPETIDKVIASGKTPAGQHRPILVDEVLDVLDLKPGDRGADATFGYGGHSEAILGRIRPGGQLLGLDVDTVQLPRSEKRLRDLGFRDDELVVKRSNYAGLGAALEKLGWSGGIDFVLADLGLSSMQIDNPERGFSYKHDGPLDMRMNPERGVSAREWLAGCNPDKLARWLVEAGDEPRAEIIADALKGASEKTGAMESTRQLRRVVERSLPEACDEEQRRVTVARVFQAIRIAVNEEFSALDAFLRNLPNCLNHGGRAVILSFHSGEDRRVKHHFRDGLRNGTYQEINAGVVRPTPAEISGNPRAAPAKMRWGVRAS